MSVLDVVELHRDGERIPVRRGKTTEVLVRLALEAGVMVRTERLIEDLWADEAVGTARNVLQTKVSRLRRALDDAALVTGTSAGYTLQVDPSAVDALEVLRLAEEASALRSAGDPSAALEMCTTALAMFHGEILSAAGDADWVVPYRARLGEVRLGLIEDQLAARLDLGAAGEVIGELEALVSAHPLREGLWALLMVALYRDGRQADALATYQRARTLLGRRARPRPRTGSCSNSSTRSWSTTRHSASPRPRYEGWDRTGRPETCRRCLSSSSVARPR